MIRNYNFTVYFIISMNELMNWVYCWYDFDLLFLFHTVFLILPASNTRVITRPFFGVVTNRLFSHFEILAKEDFTIFNRNYRIPYRLLYYVTLIDKCIYFSYTLLCYLNSYMHWKVIYLILLLQWRHKTYSSLCKKIKYVNNFSKTKSDRTL